MNRREFGKTIGAGTLGLPLVANADKVQVKSAKAKSAKDDRDRQNTRPTEKPRSDVDLLLELVRRDYSDKRLTGPILSEIRGQLAGNRRRSRRLSRFPLTNTDEPGFVFTPFRGK